MTKPYKPEFDFKPTRRSFVEEGAESTAQARDNQMQRKGEPVQSQTANAPHKPTQLTRTAQRMQNPKPVHREHTPSMGFNRGQAQHERYNVKRLWQKFGHLPISRIDPHFGVFLDPKKCTKKMTYARAMDILMSDPEYAAIALSEQ